MNIEKKIINGASGDIVIYTLTNSTGASVEVSNLGAGITSIVVPDKDGNMADVVLGYKNKEDYLSDGPCAGKTPGRFANRIANGFFKIGNKEYHLATNNGPNALHGGPMGFANLLWNHEVKNDSIVFTLESKDGDEGYPGTLNTTVEYSWSEDNELMIKYNASTDAPTVVNLTNHAYFNLDGENSGSVLDHILQLNSTKYLPTDQTLVPTGVFDDVTGTPMDFIEPKKLSKDIQVEFAALKYGKGYDNCWVINDWIPGKEKIAAILYSQKSGRELTVITTQPAVQIYTGNWLKGSPISKSGNHYEDYDGVAIECQGMPDAPNKPQFPSQLLRPGEEYKQSIKFSFKIK